jgi:hypothetical protein
VSSLRSAINNKAARWTCFGLAALAVIRLYYVQEMIAALIIFSVLFALVAAVVLFLFFLDRVSQRTVAWAETRTTRVGPAAHRAWAFVVELSKKPLHRPRSQPVQ